MNFYIIGVSFWLRLAAVLTPLCVEAYNGTKWVRQVANAQWAVTLTTHRRRRFVYQTSYGGRRSGELLALPNNGLILFGGRTTIDTEAYETHSYPRSVWVSWDKGISWTNQGDAPFWGRFRASSAILSNGHIVVAGGQSEEPDASNNICFRTLYDVWRTKDYGVSWEGMGELPRPGIYFHRIVALYSGAYCQNCAGSLLLIGGRQPTAGFDNNGTCCTASLSGTGCASCSDCTQATNQVWRSDDEGLTWTLLSGTVGSRGLWRHDAVALRDGRVLVGGGELITDLFMGRQDGSNKWEWTVHVANVSFAKGSGRGLFRFVLTTADEILMIAGLSIPSATNSSSIYQTLQISAPGQDVWRGTNNGTNWTLQTGAAEFGQRIEHAATCLEDGHVVLTSGTIFTFNPTEYVLCDVWIEFSPCAPGFELRPGASSCAQCQAGSVKREYGNGPAVVGEASCVECEIGKYDQSGALQASVTGASYNSNSSNFTYTTTTPLSPLAIAQLGCASCPAGKFQLYKGSTSCDDCAAGLYASQVESSVCLTCPSGSASTAGSSACTLCPGGKYAQSVGSTECDSCSAGTKSRYLLGSKNCVNCQTGQYALDEAWVCSYCQDGWVPLSDKSDCEVCPAGSYAVSGQASCQQCVTGRYSTTGSASCSQCNDGYIPTADKSACSVCAAGKFSVSGADVCSLCLVGSYSTSGSRECTNCSLGRAAPSQSGSCTLCSGGQYSTADRSQCLPCATGHISSSGSTNCSACPDGSPANLAKTACAPCAAGTFHLLKYGDICYPCSPGQYSNAGSIGCINCQPNEVAGLGSSSCSICATGWFKATSSSTSCTPCSSGSFSVAGSTTCITCAAGKYALIGAGSCITCGVGTYSSNASSSCTACPPGLFAGSGSSNCTNCSIGYVPKADQSECEICAQGKYTSAGAASCITCASGKFASSGSTSCNDCQTGKYAGAGSGACAECSLGYIPNNAQSACQACPGGAVASLGQSACTTCTQGTYAYSGFDTCLQCGSGRYSLNAASKCDPCPSGWVAPPQSSSCTLCNDGTIPDASKASCRSCLGGEYAKAGNASCSACLPGTFSTQGSASCTACAPGRIATFNSSSCSFCPDGEVPTAGNSACRICLPGSYATPGLTICKMCLAGTYATEGQSECINCGQGTFSANASGSCTTCQDGRYATLASASCSNCNGGYIPNLLKSGCVVCVAGKFAVPGDDQCKQCAAGKFAIEGSPSCSFCQGGHKPTSARDGCLRCSSGRFAIPGWNDCTSCATTPQYLYASSGSTACSLCTPGWRGDKGSGQCIPCPTGQFSSANTSTQCETCDRGRYASSIGTTACTFCNATLTSDRGSVSMHDCMCPPDTYYEPRQAICITCVVGLSCPGSFIPSLLTVYAPPVASIRRLSSKPKQHVITMHGRPQRNQTTATEDHHIVFVVRRLSQVGASSSQGNTTNTTTTTSTTTTARKTTNNQAVNNVTTTTTSTTSSTTSTTTTTNTTTNQAVAFTMIGDPSVFVEAGYMVAPGSDEIEVFKCRKAAFCEGVRQVFPQNMDFQASLAVMDTCTHGSQGTGCGACKADTFKRGGECVNCADAGFKPAAAGTMFMIVLFILCHAAYVKSMLPPQGLDIAIGTVFSMFQAFAVIDSFEIEYPDLVDWTVVEPMKMFAFDLTVIGIPTDCVSGTSFTKRYAARLCFPIAVNGTFLLIFLIYRFPRWYAEKRMGREVESPEEAMNAATVKRIESWRCSQCIGWFMYRPRDYIDMRVRYLWFWPILWMDMKNCMIKVHMSLFIMLTNTSLFLFKFKKHPSGQRTLNLFPDVVAGSREWWEAFPLGVTAMVFYALLFFALVVWACYVAPKRVSTDPVFRRSYRSLWARFAPTSWWFVIVHAVYAVALNMIPVMDIQQRVLVMNAVILNIVYILTLVHAEPWKFRMNYTCDLITKTGLLTFLLLTMNLNLKAKGGHLDEDAFAGPIVICFFTPLVIGFILCFRYFFYNELTEVARLQTRASFAQKLHDVLQIASSRSIYQTQSYAMRLLDNDYMHLDAALDVMLGTMLGLQPQNPFRWRAAPMPFEVCVDGRLEGALIAQGLQQHNDPRILLRKLHQELDLGELDDLFRQSYYGTSKSVKKRKGCCEGKIKDTYIEGVSGKLRKVFDTINLDDSDDINEEEFVKAMHRYAKHKNELDSQFDEEDFKRIFKYLDLDKNGTISVHELAVGVAKIHEPVFPRDFYDEEVQPYDLRKSMADDVGMQTGLAAILAFNTTEQYHGDDIEGMVSTKMSNSDSTQEEKPKLSAVRRSTSKFGRAMSWCEQPLHPERTESAVMRTESAAMEKESCVVAAFPSLLSLPETTAGLRSLDDDENVSDDDRSEVLDPGALDPVEHEIFEDMHQMMVSEGPEFPFPIQERIHKTDPTMIQYQEEHSTV